MTTMTQVSKTEVNDVLKHIETNWDSLVRTNKKNHNTLIGLPNPYVVPALETTHFTFKEQYYWDSYFIALGLQKRPKLAEGMLDNLVYMLDTYKVIPNANRMYFLSRSQPPVLTSFILLVHKMGQKSDSWLKQMAKKAEYEYDNVWMSELHPHWRNVHQGLSRYYDINSLHDLAEAESGWDMTTRFKRRCLDYLPVDLNCMLYKYEVDLAHIHTLLDSRSAAKKWQARAEERKKTVSALMWSNKRRFFYDYNYQNSRRSLVGSLAGYYAMWAGLATEKQAKALVKKLRKFEYSGGLATTTQAKPDLSIFGSLNVQWAHPNGWAPLHYIVIEGLEKYGYKEDAERIANKWLKTNTDWFKRHDEMLEKYNVVKPDKPPKRGLYPNQSGFGWTNGVYAYLANKYV